MHQMPTSAKLVAGLCFLCIGFAAAIQFEPVLTEVQRGRWFAPANGALGFVVGWRIMGRLVGGTYGAAARAGIGTSVWLFFWALLIFSLREMLLRSWDKRYRTPTEAIGNMVEIGIHFGSLALRFEVIAVLVLGGMIAGVIAEFTNRRWS